MSKIVIDARIIASTTGRYVERLLHHLEKIDHSNEYLVLVRKKDEKYWTPTRSNFRIVIADFADYSFDEQLGLKRLLDSLSPDLVHFCMPQQPIFYKGLHVTTVHDLTLLKTYNSDKNWLIYKSKQLVGKIVFKIIGHTSYKIITDSSFTKKEYVDFTSINKDKVKTVYLASENTLAKPRTFNEFKDEDFLLYVGQQSDYKNIKRLILAHQALLASHPNLRLVLVGSINEAASRNQKWVIDKNYQNVYFTGFVKDDHLAWLYENTKVYVFPSLMEGFGLPGLEAMSCGAPVVSSNATCLPEVYGNAAHYFNPYDVEGMAQAIDEVLTDNKLRIDLISKGKMRVKNFSWEQTAMQTLEVYKEALSQRG